MGDKHYIFSKRPSGRVLAGCVLFICVALAACGSPPDSSGGHSGSGSGSGSNSSVSSGVPVCTMGSVDPTVNCSTQLLLAGPYQVATSGGHGTSQITDTTRPTSACGTCAAIPTGRTLTTWYWFPSNDGIHLAAGGPFPLIVYIHGDGGTGDGGLYIEQQLASLGYIVASFDQVLTSKTTLADCGQICSSSPNSDTPNIPGDVSFFMTQILSGSDPATAPFYAMIDTSRIGLLGFSLGGGIATEVGFDQTNHDSRVKLVVGQSPAYFSSITFYKPSAGQLPPYLIMYGTMDETLNIYNASYTGYTPGGPYYKLDNGSKDFAALAGGTHTGFSQYYDQDIITSI